MASEFCPNCLEDWRWCVCDPEECRICGEADGECDCEARADFIGDNSLFHPDEDEEEFWDHED